MFRIKLILIIGGGVLCFMGYQEFQVSQGTSAEPVGVNLSALEKGDALPNNHIRVGSHMALYPASIYAYSKGKHDNSAPGNSTKVKYAFYPLLSDEHPFVQQLKKLIQAITAGQEIPEGVDPRIDDFKILVKTERFKTIGDIPSEPEKEDHVQGLVINKISSLDKEEENLIKQSFPNVNVSQIFILEEGRTPASIMKSGGMILGGLILIVAGGFWMFVGREA